MNLIRESDPTPDEQGVVTFRGDLHRPKATFSFWQLSPIDVLRVMRGRPIRVGVFGQKISIDTEE